MAYFDKNRARIANKDDLTRNFQAQDETGKSNVCKNSGSQHGRELCEMG